MNAKGGSSDQAKKHLMTRLASMRQANEQGVQESRAADPTDFSTLPGFEELRVQRAVGAQLGLGNPYFKLHDGRASAHTIIGNTELLNFSCYDYLGLNNDPRVMEAARAAVAEYGVSSSASRVVAGERRPHRELERALADHYRSEDCVVLVSGYATNVGVIGQLAGPKDLIIYDSVSHNSVVMGSVMSGAVRRTFAHNDLNNLDEILAGSRDKFERVLIVVEGLYSMDGDYPDLPALIALKKKYRAWLMVDEAHAMGVLGARGSGIAEHYGVNPRDVDIWMGTLSKTLAGCGGYIAGSATLVDYLRSLCHAFVYSVGMPPAVAAASGKALRILHDEPERVQKLQHNSALFHDLAKDRGLDTGTAMKTAVCPIIVGDSVAAVLLSQRMFERGINVQPVLYPAVPAKTSRLRFFLTAMHEESDLRQAIDILAEEVAALPERLQALNIPRNASEVF